MTTPHGRQWLLVGSCITFWLSVQRFWDMESFASEVCSHLLDMKFNLATFEPDVNTWETSKHWYKQQVGSPLPDGVLVATKLNMTTGAFQQRLRLNVRTLQTYQQQTRDTIVKNFRSKLILRATSSSCSSNNGPAPMDVGAIKGKGKKGWFWPKGKGKSRGGKGKKGKGKGKGLSGTFKKRLS